MVGSVNWQDWSKFGEPEIAVAESDTITADLDYQDTYHVGLGVYYRVDDPWLLMAGFGYDSSPLSSSKDRSPALPFDEIFSYSGGVQYDWSGNLSIGAAYTLIAGGKGEVDKSGGTLQGDLKGEYETYLIHAFNLNFVYRDHK